MARAPNQAPPLVIPKKVKVSVVCTSVLGDGKTVKLPGKKLRLEQAIACEVSGGVASAGLKATLWTKEGAKPKSKNNGTLNSKGAWKVELGNGQEYESCANFTIEAEVNAPDGKVLGKKALKIKQFCPD